jgi:hypothetical protein
MLVSLKDPNDNSVFQVFELRHVKIVFITTYNRIQVVRCHLEALLAAQVVLHQLEIVTGVTFVNLSIYDVYFWN